jgi:hypothetical protein
MQYDAGILSGYRPDETDTACGGRREQRRPVRKCVPFLAFQKCRRFLLSLQQGADWASMRLRSSVKIKRTHARLGEQRRLTRPRWAQCQ